MAWIAPGNDANGNILAANVLPLGVYADQPNGQVNANPALNIFWRKNNVDARGSFNTILITGINIANAAAGATSLNILGSQPAGVNVGGLVIETGLPANFGRGRGRWRQDDIQYIEIDMLGEAVSPSADIALTNVAIVNRVTSATFGPPEVRGDVAIQVQNLGAAAADPMTLRIRFIPEEER